MRKEFKIYGLSELHNVAGFIAELFETLIINLNNVIDRNKYPVPETEISNRRHRPLGIGVQGLADLFAELRLPFESEAARKLNIQILMCIW